ncbi:MAG: PDZ domain-containing protein [Pirellulales bacterium]
MTTFNNNSIAYCACILLVALSVSTSQLAAQDLNQLEQQAIQAAVEHVTPAMVQIETLGGLEKVGKQLVASGTCTGTAVTADGYILSSAYNFAQKPTSILVTLPSGKRTSAKIIARDQSRMLVLLKVNSDEQLSVPEFIQRDKLQVGQWTIALGKTFSPDSANVSVGVLSAVNRVWGKAVQTDAKISPNNYGGPLIDIHGRVMGILVPLSPQAKGELAGSDWYDSGIGFAVPIEGLLSRFDQMKNGNDLMPGLLGINLKGADIVSDPAEIGAVSYNSPAQKAGIEVGDVIVKMNGNTIVRQAQLKHTLGPLYSGDLVKITVRREKKEIELEAELADQLVPFAHPFLGILPMRDASTSGVVVRYVYPDSPAATAKIATGDIVTKLGENKITNATELRSFLATHDPEKSVQLTIQRGEETLAIDLQTSILPESILQDLPSAFASDAEAPKEKPTTGELDIQLQEEANKSFAWVPDNYHPSRPAGVILWHAAPGALDKEATKKTLIQQWKTPCEKNNLILLVVGSANDSGWSRTEADVVRKCLDQLSNSYSIDPIRTAATGINSGGSMSYLVAFKHREVIGAVAAFEAPVPRGTTPPDADPLNRLLFFTAYPDKGDDAAQFASIDKSLRAMKYSVTHVDTTQEKEIAGIIDKPEYKQLIRWIDSLDRI